MTGVAALLGKIEAPHGAQLRAILTTTGGSLWLRMAALGLWLALANIALGPWLSLLWVAAIVGTIAARRPWEKRILAAIERGQDSIGYGRAFLAVVTVSNTIWLLPSLSLWFAGPAEYKLFALVMLAGLYVFLVMQFAGAVSAVVIAGLPYFAATIFMVASMPSLPQQLQMFVALSTMLLAIYIMFDTVTRQQKQLAASNQAFEDALAQAERQLARKKTAITHLFADIVANPAAGEKTSDSEGPQARLGRLMREIEARDAAMLKGAEQLRDARIQADAANAAKSSFIAHMSHELRTPLNAIIGFAEILEEDMRAASRIENSDDAARILRAGRHLLGLINEVLDMAKIESGHLHVAPALVDAHALAHEIVQTVQPLAAQGGNQVEILLAPNLRQITTDPHRLRQCLLNLLSNAAKFTEKGSITLAATRVHEHGQDLVRFQVSDTGSGMSAEQLSRAFEPFVQVDSSTTRAQSGTGLGLPITRRLAQLLGGDLTAISTPGRGSTFTLTIAAQLEAKAAEEDAPDTDDHASAAA